ncbi:hypothetical protein F4778DRAFT_587645 [Xylariomycetidae sp. FL2044]|nr:hypothetical protein F4778DRAFT_587645 [Xylariomycetidae sp. FL2044]
MALFVDLDEEEGEPPQAHQHHYTANPEWISQRAKQSTVVGDTQRSAVPNGTTSTADHQERENPNRNGMTEALGCYPIATAIASSLDLNTLDNLSRTCRQIHEALLQYRSSLLTHTLHCANEDVPVDPEDTFRYRARAGNWYYMEGGRTTDYSGKSGRCARDLVGECRRCGTVVCRNCAIKPPAQVTLRHRHRRLCIPCMRAPLGTLAKPPLRRDTPLESGEMQRAICTCVNEGVWLCQPCGRTIRGADGDYQSIWKWRYQYGEVLGGLGTGIGEGDRGVICGRESACCGAKEREQETDCGAADAREHDEKPHSSPWASTSYLTPTAPPTYSATSSSNSNNSSTTPSPPASLSGASSSSSSMLPLSTGSPSSPSSWRGTPRPGYARHEIEGIGGVVKTKLVSIVRVGACVPEWEDEKNRGEILGREISGRSRSLCGWCWRVIPGGKDLEGKNA